MRPTPAEGGFGPKGGPPSHSSYNKWIVSFVSLCWLPHGMSVFGRWNLCFGCCCMCIKGCEGRSSRASRFLDGRLHDRLAGFASERSWPKGLVRSNELRPQCLFFLRAVQPETELAGHLMDCPPRGQIRNVGGGLVSKEGGHHMCKGLSLTQRQKQFQIWCNDDCWLYQGCLCLNGATHSIICRHLQSAGTSSH